MRKSQKERQEDIVQAVVELAASGDVRDVTTQAIADRIGIAQPTVFRHFPNRDAIFLAAINWASQAIFKVLEHVFASDRPADERLRLLLQRQLELVSKHRGIPRILFSEGLYAEGSPLRERILAVLEGYERQIAALILGGVESGRFRKGLDPQQAARMLVAMVQGLITRWSLSGFAFPLEKQGEALWRFIWPALAPEKPSPAYPRPE